jgi:hypothetical protein
MAKIDVLREQRRILNNVAVVQKYEEKPIGEEGR